MSTEWVRVVKLVQATNDIPCEVKCRSNTYYPTPWLSPPQSSHPSCSPGIVEQQMVLLHDGYALQLFDVDVNPSPGDLQTHPPDYYSGRSTSTRGMCFILNYMCSILQEETNGRQTSNWGWDIWWVGWRSADTSREKFQNSGGKMYAEYSLGRDKMTTGTHTPECKLNCLEQDRGGKESLASSSKE